MHKIVFFALMAVAMAKSAYFWQVTDVHYQMDYKVGGDPDNQCHGSGGSAGKYGDYLCNTPWRSLKQITNFIINRSQELGIVPDFVTFTGDVMSARDADWSKSSLGQHMTNWTTLLRKVRKAFNNQTKIFPMHGNHDAAPTQHEFPADSSYYSFQKAYRLWNKFLSDDAKKTLEKGGYYSEVIRPGLRFMAYNTGLYYTGNDSIKIDGDTDPLDQFAWIKKTLTDARANGEKVIMASHICPGLVAAGDRYDMYDPWVKNLHKALDGFHKDVIVAGFYGHNHCDSFHIIKDINGDGESIGFMTGAGTSRMNINPSVTLFKYSPEPPFTILDKYVYYYDLKKANKNDEIVWRTLYHMKETYNMTDLSTASMKELATRLDNYDSTEWKTFYENMYVKGPDHSCGSKCHKQIMCAIKHTYGDEAEKCTKM